MHECLCDIMYVSAWTPQGVVIRMSLVAGWVRHYEDDTDVLVYIAESRISLFTPLSPTKK